VINVTIEFKGLVETQKKLERFRTKLLPTAVRRTLNDLAYMGRNEWNKRLGESPGKLRNTFTARQTTYVKAVGDDVSTMRAVLGNSTEWVRQLEVGEGEHAKHNVVPIPEVGAHTGKTRDKLISKPNKLRKLFTGTSAGKTWKARNAYRLRRAAKKGEKVLVLENSRGRAIYRVKSRKTVTKLWDLRARFVKRPKRPTLEATMGVLRAAGPAIALKAIDSQLKKL
jgi:hypothetical protein